MNSPLTNINSYDKSVTLREQLRLSGIQHFLDMPNITEVAVNEPFKIMTESSKGWTVHDVPQCTLAIALDVAKSASIFQGGTPLDFKSPIKSVRLPGGQRGQVVIPPGCSPNTVALTFRTGGEGRYPIDSFVTTGRFENFIDVSVFKQVPDNVHLQPYELDLLAAKNSRDMKRFFQLCVDHKLNICIAGATGSGKTAFMKALCDMIPVDTRLITIEDTHELSLPYHANKVHMFYGDYVTPKDVLKSCMRMKPDRILLTELRGDEAFDFIASLNTGHAGSITTAHANSPLDTYKRIATLVKQSDVGLTLDLGFLVQLVTTSIDVVVQFARTNMTQLYYDPVRRAKMMRGDSDV